MGHSLQDIKRLCPGTDVREGLAIQGAKVARAEKEIKRWIEE